MTARNRLVMVAGLGAVSLLAACASSSKPAPATVVQQSPEMPDHLVEGEGTQSDRTAIQNTDNQIYGAEHATGSDFPVVVSGTNQDIP